MNAQLGGLTSFRQLASEIRLDLASVIGQFWILSELLRGKRKKAAEDFAELREIYDFSRGADPVRGALFAVLFTLFPLLIFEAIWVPLYDYFQFGRVLWPVYFAGTSDPFLGEIFLRNCVFSCLAAVAAYACVRLVWDGELRFTEGRTSFSKFWFRLSGTGVRPRFRIAWRVDRVFVALVLLASASWLIWISGVVPHPIVTSAALGASNVLSMHGISQATLSSGSWAWPQQHFFPQTEYTFYNSTLVGQTYTEPQIFGFYVDVPALHLVNVITKYLTFAAVCYPAMVIVGKASK